MLARFPQPSVPSTFTLNSNSSPSPSPGLNGANEKEPSQRDQLVCALVRRYLLLAQVSAAEWSRNETALFMLADSLLGSSIAPSSSIANEDAVAETIKKRLAKTGPEGIEKAVKFSNMVTSLKYNYPSHKLWGILYFLLRVAEKDGQGRSGSTSARMVEMLSGPIQPRITSTIARQDTPLMNFGRVSVVRPAGHHLEMSNLSEQALLRDLAFVLQGTEGTLIKMNPRTGTFMLLPNGGGTSSSTAIRVLVDKIAECGTLCFRIRERISPRTPSTGTIKRSFHTAIEAEIREYLKVVACFEAAIANNESGMMTLRKALAWFQGGPFQKLNFIDNLLRETDKLHGGALITFVHKNLQHGSLEISQMVSRLVEEMINPFFMMLAEFVQYGSLQDPYNEFFIVEHSSKIKQDGEAGGGDIRTDESWISSFSIDNDRLPAVITFNLAGKALLAGKTRSFLAKVMSSGTGSDSMMMEVDQNFHQSKIDANSIVPLIKREHQLACQQLSKLLSEKFSIKLHLGAIRDFIHFGRGDFASALIENLSVPLSKPAGSLFRHALVSCLDQALLSLPNFTIIGDLRERLDVRLHEANNPKLTGWDVFTLDYKINFPLDVILSPSAMSEHVRLSHFLWSLRRVYFVVNNCWSRVLAMQKLTIGKTELVMDLKRLQLFLLEAHALSRQASSYSLTIVQKCWERFFLMLNQPDAINSGLDYYINSHDRLLSELKRDLFIFSHGALKAKLASVLSALLRAESVVKGFERFISQSLEYERRNENAASSSLGRRRSSSHWMEGKILYEGDNNLESFNGNKPKLLAEQRAAFQHTTRQFQTELDELFLQLQKEAQHTPEVAQLTLLLDYNGYHKSRNGFDIRKYCSVPK